MYPRKIEPKNKKYSVYVHYMKPTGKRYVGVTGQEPNRRFQHGAGYEKCTEFYKDIKQYGWSSVETTIIAETEDFELAHEFEAGAIKRWNTLDSKYGYNSWSSGLNNKPKESVGKHISEAKMGHEVSQETREKLSKYYRKKVAQYDLEGNFIKVFDSMTEASNSVGAFKTNISAVCKGQKPTCRGYKWKFYEEGVSNG